MPAPWLAAIPSDAAATLAPDFMHLALRRRLRPPLPITITRARCGGEGEVATPPATNCNRSKIHVGACCRISATTPSSSAALLGLTSYGLLDLRQCPLRVRKDFQPVWLHVFIEKKRAGANLRGPGPGATRSSPQGCRRSSGHCRGRLPSPPCCPHTRAAVRDRIRPSHPASPVCSCDTRRHRGPRAQPPARVRPRPNLLSALCRRYWRKLRAANKVIHSCRPCSP